MYMGNKHDYLGVDLEFDEDGTLNVSIVAEFPEMIAGKATMPAAHTFSP